MTLNTSDPDYRAEVIPASISAMQAPLCTAYGVGADHFGAKGSTGHVSGYHRSRAWILGSPDSAWGANDYSVQSHIDTQGDPDWISAVDFTPGVWGTDDNRSKMMTLTRRLIDAAQSHDPRMGELREIAGTLDGVHVVTFDCTRMEFKDPFDSSHLDHIHESFLRGMADQSHTGVVAVMLGQDAQEVDMRLIVKFADSPTVFLTDFITSRAIAGQAELSQLFAFAHTGELKLGPRNAADAVYVAGPEWKASILGVLIGDIPVGFEDYADPAGQAHGRS